MQNKRRWKISRQMLVYSYKPVEFRGDKKLWLRQEASNLPASPSFSPHLWFVSFVWREVITVETIAGVDLFKTTDK